MERKLKLGMIGGGQGAFIGAVHRIAARIDNAYELVAGAFSSHAARSLQSGLELGLPEHRIYGSYHELINGELDLPPHARMEVVSIVTPNHVHFQPAALALEKGFHVVLDKPMTYSLQEAIELQQIAQKNGKLLCVTHTYTGYPMIKQARALVKSGELGAIRKVYVEYPQGWLSTGLEQENQKQASWRTDPSRSGLSGCMGDIGTHAFNLAEYVSGEQVTHVSAQLETFVPGRRLDDDGAALLKFTNGVSGVLIATQIAAGEENNLRIRVYGEKGGLEWQQQDANSLWVKWLHEPAQLYRSGAPYTNSISQNNTRVPPGHPEGYLEAFANHYTNFAKHVIAVESGQQPTPEALDYPSVEEGLRGMAFVETVVKSSQSSQKWTPFASISPNLPHE